MRDQPVKDKILQFIRQRGAVRPKDLTDRGWPRIYLNRLIAEGRVQKVSRGIYASIDAPATESHTLVEAAIRVSDGVVCLLSALQFHGLTTEMPIEVWMAIEQDTSRGKPGYPPIRLVRFSGKGFKAGVLRYNIEKVEVKIYSPEKTIADCWSFRNTIGLDVCIESLKNYMSSKEASLDELWKFAKLRRVARVMRPYMEALA